MQLSKVDFKIISTEKKFLTIWQVTGGGREEYQVGDYLWQGREVGSKIAVLVVTFFLNGL